MRRLVVTQKHQVDGSIEMLGDWFDPQADADVVTGSSTLTHALIAAGLASDGVQLARLRRLDAKAFGNGVTYAAYAPAR